MDYLMYSLPIWAVFGIILGAGLLVFEIGYKVARFLTRGTNDDTEKKDPESVGGIVATLFGLLAFILAFAFSITTGRFDKRKELVVQEANAISTSYLRAGLIPQTEGTAIKKLLEEYVDVRLQMAAINATPGELIKRAEEIHGLLWKQVELLSKEDMDSEIRSLLISSVNEVIDLHTTRKTVALVHRIPSFVWYSIHLLFIVCMFSTGYQVGLSGKLKYLATPLPLMIAAFALIIVMIGGMDRSNDPRFKVSQQPMMEVLEMMRKPPQ